MTNPLTGLVQVLSKALGTNAASADSAEAAAAAAVADAVESASIAALSTETVAAIAEDESKPDTPEQEARAEEAVASGDDTSTDDKSAVAPAQADAAEAERQRWSKVLKSDAAKGKLDTAVALLEQPIMGADAIIGVLATVPAGQSSAAARLAAQTNPALGSTPDTDAASSSSDHGWSGVYGKLPGVKAAR